LASDSPEALAKVALLTHLRASGALRSRVLISELAVEKWARRADLAAVGSQLTCFEVKSGADRLTRLDDQLSAYLRVFDHVYAVVATKHMNSVMSRVPTCVGLMELVQGSRGLEARHVREAALSGEVDAKASLNLLPVTELGKLIRSLGNGPCGGQSRESLMRAAMNAPLTSIRAHLSKYLSMKYAASSVSSP